MNIADYLLGSTPEYWAAYAKNMIADYLGICAFEQAKRDPRWQLASNQDRRGIVDDKCREIVMGILKVQE
jgi:hypothetical protein